jgi:hypothetical protein
MCADGESYERSAIEAWFATGKRTSPRTNEELRDTAVVPNLALKRMIVQWKDSAGAAASAAPRSTAWHMF